MHLGHLCHLLSIGSMYLCYLCNVLSIATVSSAVLHRQARNSVGSGSGVCEDRMKQCAIIPPYLCYVQHNNAVCCETCQNFRLQNSGTFCFLCSMTRSGSTYIKTVIVIGNIGLTGFFTPSNSFKIA